MGIRLLSSILRSKWLIEHNFAESQLPLVSGIINGNHINFSSDKPTANPYFTNVNEYDERGHKPLITIGAVGSTFQASRWRSFDDAPKGSLAVIPVNGPILKYGGECGEPGTIHMIDWVKQAIASDRISAIIIRIDSPGGMVDGTTTLADAIKNSDKPTIAIIDDGMMASAAMWIGSAADAIYASQKTDMIGSIGVYTTLWDYEERLKMMGVRLHEIYAPESTEKNDDYKQALKGNYKKIETELSFICQEFISTIKSNRADKLNLSAGDPFKGAMYFAEEATKIGLIDGIKSFDQVVYDLMNNTGATTGNKKSTTSNTKNMFGSNFKKVAALKGKKAEEISAEEIQAANAELVLEGITSVVLGPDLSAKIASLEDQIAVAATEKENQNKIIADLQAEITRLGKEAGATPTNASKSSEAAENKAEEQTFESFDHNKKALNEISGI
jgi:ClpP class serine protease